MAFLFRTRPRSPLAGATPTQIAALRALVVAYREWESRLGTPTQTLTPRVPTTGRALQLSLGVEVELAARTRARVNRRPDVKSISRIEEALREAARLRGVHGGAHLEVLHAIHSELVTIRKALTAAE